MAKKKKKKKKWDPWSIENIAKCHQRKLDSRPKEIVVRIVAGYDPHYAGL